MVLVIDTLTQTLDDSRELFEMGKSEEDDDTILAVQDDLLGAEKTLETLEFRRMFSNPMDPNHCFIDIQAGAGGTEAQDWASMLLRMYLRYCERKDFKVEVLEESEGEVAGIKSATIKVDGDYAYGYLRTEVGVHRLVRNSPFDSNNRRQTSFASVFVYPEVDDSIEIDINPADLRVDTYRASGAGGQGVLVGVVVGGVQCASLVAAAKVIGEGRALFAQGGQFVAAFRHDLVFVVMLFWGLRRFGHDVIS